MEMGTAIGSYAPDFELPGSDESVHHLSRYLERFKAVGVVFMCNHCPYVHMYLELNFPYLRDVTQDVAHSFGAEKTPHVFLLDRHGVLCYSGRMDDNAEDASGVKVTYFGDAIAQILSGTPVKTTSTTPIGCSVKWRT